MDGNEDFVCSLPKVEKMLDWFNAYDEENQEDCRPCLVGPVASYYYGALEEAGDKVRLEQLRKAYESGEILTIVKELDIIKSQVGEDLKAKLVNIDCMGQEYRQDEAK